MRIYALYIVVGFLSLYAWKDWFRSLCGLILLMAIIQHPDMPQAFFDIPGLNLWNVLFVNVLLAWATSRGRQGLRWDMPRGITVMLLVYVGVILLGVWRAAMDPGHMVDYPLRNLISEELINTIKWILPGVLLFDGCRTRRQVVTALACLLVVYLAFAVQVIKWMPPGAAISASGSMERARGKLAKEVGYSAADLSVMLGGACWGLLAALPLIRKWRHRIAVLAGVGVVSFGQALTGGRGGYLAWGATGLVLCLMKWRRYLVFAPVVVLLLPVILPGATARMLTGFRQTNTEGQPTVDEEAATSGRTAMWPYVVAKIKESPWIGYGRQAMRRTGLSQEVGVILEDDTWPHPHNMYLETLLDNGMTGAMPIWLLFALMVVCSGALFRSSNHLYSATGGLALSLMLTELLGGISGQHYYPQEHTLGIWAAFFLSLRVYVEEKRAVGCVVDDSETLALCYGVTDRVKPSHR